MIYDFSEKATQVRFGDLVGISRQRVAQLIEMSVLSEEGTIGSWHKSYIDNLRDTKSGHGSSDIQAIVQKAKARKDKLDGDIKEIKIGELTGELGDVSILEKGMSAISETFFRTGKEAKEKILKGIKAELDIEVPVELINDPIDEHLASLEGANPREFIRTS